jgi:hypothetical protein
VFSRNDRGIRMTGTTDRCRIRGVKALANAVAPLSTTGSLNQIDKDSCDFGQGLSQVVATDANVTLGAFLSATKMIHTGTLTAARDVTLSLTTGAQTGQSFRITRSGGGAFNLNVLNGSGGATIKALATGTWGEFTFNGTAWILTAYGSL